MFRIVFDGPPGPVAGRFVEVENMDGASVRVGEWKSHPQSEGMWCLEIPSDDKLRALADRYREALEELLDAVPGTPEADLARKRARALLIEWDAALNPQGDKAPRMSVCVHCDTSVPLNEPCPECGRGGVGNQQGDQ